MMQLFFIILLLAGERDQWWAFHPLNSAAEFSSCLRWESWDLDKLWICFSFYVGICPYNTPKGCYMYSSTYSALTLVYLLTCLRVSFCFSSIPSVWNWVTSIWDTASLPYLEVVSSGNCLMLLLWGQQLVSSVHTYWRIWDQDLHWVQ